MSSAACDDIGMDINLIESSGIVDQGQHKILRSTEVISGQKVRIVVDLDSSYPRMQSSAHADVWSPSDLRWNRVVNLISGEWTADTYARPGGKQAVTDDILAAADNLRGQVESILT